MWKKSEYTKGQINEAGRNVSNPNITNEKRLEYLSIIDNWRAAHAFPMNTFAINLKHQVSDIPSAIVVQRLKRLNTILNKLQRYPSMELYRMQDLGGCRVIVPTISDVYRIKSRLKNSRIRHEEHNCKDYISNPKSNTGYRGIHVIYRYKSEKRSDYNGLQIEIQFRTKLQHLWATAVETIGVFTHNGLKFNQGSDRWLRFFKVVSALFSVEEKSAIVEGVPTDPKEIATEVESIMKELNVTEKLYTIGLAAKHIGHLEKSRTPGYYLLVLDLNKLELVVKKLPNIEKATEEYQRHEVNRDSNMTDVVLVSAQSFESLTHAYPNYFADIQEFSVTLAFLLEKYKKSIL